MDDEVNRLRTFTEWPLEVPFQAGVLAQAGFFSTGRGVEVQCWRCGGRISEWGHEGSLEVIHRRLDPRCPLLLVQTDSASLNRPSDTGSESDPPPVSESSTDENTNDTIYKIDVLRLMSFTDWPLDFISRESLASAGFYYLRGVGGGGDRVRCAWCGGELRNWARGDSPLTEHLKHFPHCHYATHKQYSYTTTHTHNRSVAPPSIVNVMNSPLQVNEGVLARGVEGVVLGVRGAAEVGMAPLEVRERSFAPHWPPHLTQQPKDLAAAGFYYVGPDDQVRCFQCGGGLKSWMRDDDPWMEHSKWFPSCPYLALAMTTDSRVNSYMGQPPALQALSCGLQEHCVRTAIINRLRTEGTPFLNTESLIDAALHEQILQQETFPSSHMETQAEASSNSPPPVIYIDHLDRPERKTTEGNIASSEEKQEGTETEEQHGEKDGCSKTGTDLEEENRRLKEARLCKVCMDTEVGIVFLPCGHLVSCVHCAPCLTSCPLCRAPVKGIVRTYLS